MLANTAKAGRPAFRSYFWRFGCLRELPSFGEARDPARCGQAQLAKKDSSSALAVVEVRILP
jgi:hypothetical protein